MPKANRKRQMNNHRNKISVKKVPKNDMDTNVPTECESDHSDSASSNHSEMLGVQMDTQNTEMTEEQIRRVVEGNNLRNENYQMHKDQTDQSNIRYNLKDNCPHFTVILEKENRENLNLLDAGRLLTNLVGRGNFKDLIAVGKGKVKATFANYYLANTVLESERTKNLFKAYIPMANVTSVRIIERDDKNEKLEELDLISEYEITKTEHLQRFDFAQGERKHWLHQQKIGLIQLKMAMIFNLPNFSQFTNSVLQTIS